MPWALLFAVLGVLCRIPGVLYQSSKAGVACGRIMAHMCLVQVGGRWSEGRGCIHQRLACFVLHCLSTDAACLWLTQVLAVAVSGVTDLWTRQAFVKAEQLQQQQQQQQQQQRQQHDVPVRQETAATCAGTEEPESCSQEVDHNRRFFA